MARTNAEMTGSSSSAIERRPADFGSRIKALLLTVVLVIVTLVVGWLVWSVLEWRRGSTASYRLTGLRVVRRSDGRPIGLARSIVRNGICCTLLLVPTIVACWPDRVGLRHGRLSARSVVAASPVDRSLGHA